MSADVGWTREEQAQQVARRLKPGSYVNLGVGMPSLVAAAIAPGQGIAFHCENGLIGYRSLAADETPDPDIIDARSDLVGLNPGAAVVAHDMSFAIIRCGRLDATVLGAFQVSAVGDLANWKGASSRVAGVGGAMDLAIGARQVIVMMRHLDRAGTPKIVETCSYPLTAPRCVDLIVTELAVIAVTPEGLVVEEMAPGVTAAGLIEATAAPLRFPPSVAKADQAVHATE